MNKSLEFVYCTNLSKRIQKIIASAAKNVNNFSLRYLHIQASFSYNSYKLELLLFRVIPLDQDNSLFYRWAHKDVIIKFIRLESILKACKLSREFMAYPALSYKNIVWQPREKKKYLLLDSLSLFPVICLC